MPEKDEIQAAIELFESLSPEERKIMLETMRELASDQGSSFDSPHQEK